MRNIFHNIENAFVGIATPHYVSDGRFYLESNNIKDGQVNYETKVFISEEFYQRQKNKWLRAGDIVMVQSGHVGHSAVIPEELDCSAAHALIMFRKQKVKISSNFLNYQFQTKQSKKKLDLITTGNTIKHILSSEMKEFNANFPTLPEQKAIGTFFSTLDRQITLHQRKLDKLKSVKQAYLSEMFPAEGERVPKRRFPGFTDAWELRKLKELADFSKGLGYTKNDLTESGNPIILYGRLYTKYQTVIDNVDTFVDVKDKSVVSIGGEVIVPSSGESSEDIARASVVDNAGVILGGDLNVIKPKDEIDSAFLALTISNGQQQKELSKRAQGKSVVHLHNSDLKEVNLIFPSIDEQKQIGELFKGIENTITLHQRKS